MRSHKYLKASILFFVLAFVCLGYVIINGATGTPSTLVVRTDANNYLVVAGAVQTNPVTQGVFSSRVLKTDASGNLLVVQASGSAGFSASTCAAPSIYETGATTTGIAFTATPSILQCIAGTAVGTLTGSSYTLTVPILLPNGTAAAPSYSFLDEPDFGWFRVASGRMGLSNANGERFTVDTVNARVMIPSDYSYTWAAATFNDGQIPDVSLSRAASKLLNSDSSIQITRGTITTDLRTFESSVTWNAAGVTFTGWKLVVTDTASAAGSLFLDLQTLAGGSLFKVAKTGLVSSNAGYQLTSITVDSATAPTIASGGCTSPAIETNGTAGIKVTIGTSCTGVKTVVLTFPAAAHFWSCNGHNNTSDAQQQTNYPVFRATSTTSVTLTSYDRVLGTQEDFTASDIYLFNCRAE